MSEETQDVNTWHKSLCLAFRKLGVVEMLITDADIEPLQKLQPDDMPAMVAVSAEDGLHLILTTQALAQEFKENLQPEESGSKLVLPQNYN